MKTAKNNGTIIIFAIFAGIAIIILSSIILTDYISNDYSFDSNNSLKKVYVNGIVDSVYNNESQHGYKYIAIRNFDNSKLDVNLIFFSESFSSVIKKGDTVLSYSHSDTIIIKKNGTNMYLKKTNNK